ncbi:MAG: CpaD family pilus assembly protein [Xanthobacteraceae bacterium]|nr:CpaD family pilus assembly protein [Xanthobacteraceae bacterium]
MTKRASSPGRGPRRSWCRAVLAVVIGLSPVALAGCNETTQDVVGSIPTDYRLRHPIVIEEANRATELFIGSGRSGLTEAQRADVLGLGRSWIREGTGAITIDLPADTTNARAARDSVREIQAVLGAAGVPARAIRVHNYRPADPRVFATIRLTYPRVVADAGPCGVWPEDLGPSINNPSYLENKPYHNFGCAVQRNIAAMVDNPADLVQPRAETPAYTSRRDAAFEKYRKGESTTATYPEADKAKLSDVGK